MRSSRANDGPSIPGICTSRTTTAGGSSCTAWSASAPSWASTTRKPLSARSWRSAASVSTSSSTMSTGRGREVIPNAMRALVHIAFPRLQRQVKRPGGMRTAVEVVPKLGVKSGMPALRIGGVATYDRPIEHLAGQLDVLDLRVPLRSNDGRYGLVLCFALESVPLDRLGAELIRVSHPDGEAEHQTVAPVVRSER